MGHHSVLSCPCLFIWLHKSDVYPVFICLVQMGSPDNYFSPAWTISPSKQIPLPRRHQGGLKVIHLSGSIFFPLFFVVELLFQYVRRVIPFNTVPAAALLLGTVINHNTEKQSFICIQLPSTFEAADLELNFFFFSSPRGSPCLFSERSMISELWASYLVFLFFSPANLIQLELVKAQPTFA